MSVQGYPPVITFASGMLPTILALKSNARCSDRLQRSPKIGDLSVFCVPFVQGLLSVPPRVWCCNAVCQVPGVRCNAFRAMAVLGAVCLVPRAGRSG